MLVSTMVHWLHIASAMIWVGGSAFIDFIILPLLRNKFQPQQREILGVVYARTKALFSIVGALTIITGIIRGTIFGIIVSWDMLITPYGVIWLIGLLLSIGQAIWGAIAIGKNSQKLFDNHELWIPEPSGLPSPKYKKAVKTLALFGIIHLGGFVLIITCMVLMSRVLI